MTSHQHTEKGISTMLTIVIVIAAIIIAAALYVNFKNKQEKMPADNIYKPAPNIEVRLNEQNNSGISGTAYIVKAGAGTEISVLIEGSSDGASHPAHIHNGSCASLGGVVYPLSNTDGGLSETALAVSFDEIKNGGPFAVNLHESAENISNYIACGDFPK